MTGEAVFPGKKFNDVLKKNKACKINLDLPVYQSLSLNARDLMRRMLEVDPKQRIDALSALNHKFFQQSSNIKQISTFESVKGVDTDQLETDDNKENKSSQENSKSTKPSVYGLNVSHNRFQNDEEDGQHGSFITRDIIFMQKEKLHPGEVYFTQNENENISAIGHHDFSKQTEPIGKVLREGTVRADQR